MPIAMNAAFIPTAPPPITITVAAATPGTPPSRIPRPPSGFSRKKAPAWVAILPATSLIGASSGSPPWAVLDGLVGDAGRAALLERLGELRRRGQVQVGEQGVLRPQHLDLRRLRLLDPQDHLRLVEDRVRVGQDLRALGCVGLIRDRAALAGAGLDQDLVAVLRELARARPE